MFCGFGTFWKGSGVFLYIKKKGIRVIQDYFSQSFLISFVAASLDEVMFSFLAFGSLKSCFYRPLSVVSDRGAFSHKEFEGIIWFSCFLIHLSSVAKSTTNMNMLTEGQATKTFL